jgi:hypothetical protein
MCLAKTVRAACIYHQPAQQQHEPASLEKRTRQTSVKSYLASFKKFFRWMGETGRVSPQTVAEVLDTLKEERNVFLRRAAE